MVLVFIALQFINHFNIYKLYSNTEWKETLKLVLKQFFLLCNSKSSLISEIYSIRSFPPKNVPNHYYQIFHIRLSSWGYWFGILIAETTKVKNFLKLSYLYICPLDSRKIKLLKTKTAEFSIDNQQC